MSVPLPQGYINSNEVFIDQSRPQAGPSNYARPPPPAPQAPAYLQGPPPQTPFYGMNGHIPPVYPVHISQPQHLVQQQQFMAPYPPPGIIPHGQPGIVYPGGYELNGGATVPNFHFGSVPQNGAWMDEWADGGLPHEGQDMVYSNLEVKHRRRTTPDQLRILEYWYEINPKPDNALREHLAAQLGMTKRNVQVWFQNRRAKMKGLAKKDDKADGEEEQTSPEKSSNVISPVQQQPIQRQMLLPAMGPPPMTRRASLANGEAAKIEMFVAKRAAAAASGQNRGLRPPGFVSPQRSPLMGQASAARRQSIPYPTPITAGPGGPGPSPKISPVVRVMPSALHLTAMRNNTRRASMPGAAQLISSGPFTPPRLVTNQHQVGLPRELSTIKDDDDSHHGGNELDAQQHILFDPDTDFSTTYITPPPTSYDPSSVSPISFLPTDGSSTNTTFDPSLPFSPNSPLPNPSFTFGTESQPAHQQQNQQNLQQQLHHVPVLDEAEAARQQQLFFAFQQRGRMGSIASIGTYTTDNGNGTDYEDNSIGDWITQNSTTGTDGTVGNDGNQENPDGFDPDNRRASAPADLLHQIGIMGLGNNNLPTPIRPSPLGSHFTPDNYHTEHTFEGGEFPLNGTGITSSDLDPSPISMSSIPSSSSESVSPSENHQFIFSQSLYNQQQQQQQQQQQGSHQPVRSISLQQFPSSNSNGNENALTPQSQSQQQHTYQSSSVSPYSEHSIPSHQQHQHQQSTPFTQQQQAYQNLIFDGLPNTNSHPMQQSQSQNQNQMRGQHQKSGSGQNGGGENNKDDFGFLENVNGENAGISV